MLREEPARRPWLRRLTIAAAVLVGVILLVYTGLEYHADVRYAPPGPPPRANARPSPAERLEELEPPSITAPAATATYVRVEVLYGTNRRRVAGIPTSYGTRRDTLQLGTTFVSIPRGHRPGELESPAWYRLEFENDPNRHVVLLETTPLTRQGWRTRFQQSLGRSQRKEALVFVHGFNVTFEDAARRTAQLAYDLGIDGVPVMYSWPSMGEVSAYTADEATAEAAIPHFRRFLEEVAAQAGSQRVHIVAHSMGNRIVTNVLRAMAAETPQRRFNQVILAAPDIDAEVFAEQIVPAIRPSAHRISLYASSRDRALIASQRVHAFRRAGQSGPEIMVLDGLETIDASMVDTDLLGHGYFAENKQVIDDIFMVVRHDLPAHERNLHRRLKQGRPYWALE
jgi:esterase/lipase superfamily enzyme